MGNFKRYDGYVMHVPQEFIDSKLPVCPFCKSNNPHWLLDSRMEMSLAGSRTYYQCERCEAIISSTAADAAAEKRDAELAAQIEKRGYLYPYKVLFSEPKVIVFCLISAIAGVGRYGLLTWIPTYFTESLGLSIKAGIFSSILLPAGQACAMFFFPFITDKLFKGKREPMLILAAIVTFAGMITFPFIKTQILASLMLFVVGVSGMVTGVIWAIAGDMGGRAFSSTVVGILDWAVYMGAAVQASVFGFVKDSFGWPAIFITIGCLYIILLVLTLLARKMKTKKI